MTLTYDYGADGLWTCMYVSYSDESLEPDVETEGMEFGEDLEDFFSIPFDFILKD